MLYVWKLEQSVPRKNTKSILSEEEKERIRNYIKELSIKRYLDLYSDYDIENQFYPIQWCKPISEFIKFSKEENQGRCLGFPSLSSTSLSDVTRVIMRNYCPASDIVGFLNRINYHKYPGITDILIRKARFICSAKMPLDRRLCTQISLKVKLCPDTIDGFHMLERPLKLPSEVIRGTNSFISDETVVNNEFRQAFILAAIEGEQKRIGREQPILMDLRGRTITFDLWSSASISVGNVPFPY